MKLVGFEVRNYRSITTSERITLDELTVLVGPNNEGKSNVLRALVTALRVASQGRAFRRAGAATRARYGDIHDFEYDWVQDFPILLQSSKQDGKSVFRLEFELAAQDRQAFFNQIGIRLAGNLSVELSLGRESVGFNVVIPGPAKKRLAAKREEIASFIGERVDIEYIGTKRSASESNAIVERLVGRELASLRSDEEYSAALSKVREIEGRVADKLAEQLTGTLREFIPDIIRVKIATRVSTHRMPVDNEISVDDGTPTPLQRKGDGVQSLAALALMRHVRRSTSGSTSLVLAIEEPESHLHPDAIHALKRVLVDISKTHQVILTTHSPILVDRESPSRNIIVINSRAKPAKSIAAVRDVLGVRVADNLTSAAMVLLVEGPDDLSSVTSLLKLKSEGLRKALNNGILVVEHMRGATNLSYRAQLHKTNLCNVHVFIDNDEAAKSAIKKAIEGGILTTAEIHQTTVPGQKESEFEDLLDPSLYLVEIQNEFGVSLDVPEFRKGKGKWTDRASVVFAKQGKNWDLDETKVKRRIATLIEVTPAKALLNARIAVFDSLVASLEKRLGTKSSAFSKVTPAKPLSAPPVHIPPELPPGDLP